MENQHGEAAAGPGAVVDVDPDQQVSADEAATLAATLEGGAAGGSWYWTSMLNFSQSGSTSTHTSACGGQVGAQFTGSPPSSSSVHCNLSSTNLNNNNNNTGNNSNGNNQADHHGLPQLDSISMQQLASSAATACTDPAEHAVWGQEFLSIPIGETKASMHACADDGLQELLYPRTVRELLLDQSPSWDGLLQQAAINKSFGFPLGPEDHLGAPAHQLHGLNSDIKPTHAVQGLHYSHDDRLSSSTASSTLSDNTQHLSDWPPTQVQESTQGRTCPMHVPHTTLLQHQFDHTRVKQEYSQLNPATMSTFVKPSASMHSLLLQHQHQQQQHSLRLIPSNQDQATLLNEAAMVALGADVKPSKQLHSWPNSPSAISHLCRSSSSLELAGLQPPHSDPHQLLLNSMKQQHGAHQLDSAGFAAASPNLPNLISQEPAFFQPDHHHHHQQQLLQQAAAMQAAHHHAAGGAGSVQLNIPSPLQYLNQPQTLQVGMKKGRAHLEGGHVNMEEGKDMKGIDQKGIASHDDYNFKRPRVEPPQPQQPSTPASTSSFKNQPVRKEKLGERITTLQQLVSPFGKTDTASVLLEAIGYIKFLQEQVQTLSSPYLKSTNNPTTQNVDKNQNGEDVKPDLRSKGLCLVPLSCTMQVANDNGADYWYGGAFR